MKWKLESGRFDLQIKDDGSGLNDEFATILSGVVDASVNKGGKDMTLTVNPETSMLHTLTSSDFETLRGSIFEEWRDDNGTLFIFSRENASAGEIRPPHKFFDDQIEQTREKIKSIKGGKIFEWKNLETIT